MNKLAKSTFFLTILMCLAKIISFLRDLSLSYKYGATEISDAYVVAVSVPTILFSGILTALFTCYIPIYNELREKNPAYVKKFNSNVVNTVLVLSIVVILIFWIFADQIMMLLAPGFETTTFNMAVEMAKVMVISMIFMGISYVLQGYLQANGSYYLVGMMPIPINLIMAASIMFSSADNLSIMIWGTVAAYAICVPYFSWPSYRKGFRYQPYLNLGDDALKKLIYMIAPIFLGQMILEINVVVDKNLGSALEIGTITAMDYAHKVSTMVHSGVVAPISTVVYPKFSEYVVSNEENELKKLLLESLKIVMIIIIPLVIGVSVLAEPIVRILFFRGAFTEQAVKKTVECLLCYNIGIIPISLRIIMEKVFYSHQDTKIPMMNSAIGILVNVALDLILVRYFAHIGLAIATSIASAVTSFLFYIRLKRKIGSFGGKELFVTAVKTLLAGSGMGIVVWILNTQIFSFTSLALVQLIMKVIMCAILGGSVYLLLLHFLGLKELKILYLYIRHKTK